MRIAHTLVLALVIAAAGCGERSGTPGASGEVSEKDLGVKLYPRAEIEGSWTHARGSDAGATYIATCVTDDSVDRVDDFYRKVLGSGAERVATQTATGATVSYTLDRGADERITVGIMRDASNEETVFMITRYVSKQ